MSITENIILHALLLQLTYRNKKIPGKGTNYLIVITKYILYINYSTLNLSKIIKLLIFCDMVLIYLLLFK